jgi:hypothetical protein
MAPPPADYDMQDVEEDDFDEANLVVDDGDDEAPPDEEETADDDDLVGMAQGRGVQRALQSLRGLH